MPKVTRKPAKTSQKETTTAAVRSQRVDELLVGMMITEYDHRKPKFHKITDIEPSCSPFKTHVMVDNQHRWCYDNAEIVKVRVDA